MRLIHAVCKPLGNQRQIRNVVTSDWLVYIKDYKDITYLPDFQTVHVIKCFLSEIYQVTKIQLS